MMITITIPGDPTPKGRPRMTRTGHTYTPARTRDYEARIRAAWTSEKLSGPLRAIITAYIRIPKSAKMAVRKNMLSGHEKPTKRPDLDNYIKSALDGLNGLAFDDDSQVIEIIARKAYGEEPRLVISLEGL